MDETKENLAKLFSNLESNYKEKKFKTLGTQYGFSEKINDQTLGFRDNVKSWLIRILVAEIIFLMALVAFQGFGWGSFKLNNWFFSVYANACLLQTFFLMRCIVAHLFPSDPKNMGWIGLD